MMLKRSTRSYAVQADSFSELLTKSKQINDEEEKCSSPVLDYSYGDEEELGIGHNYTIQKRPSIVLQEEEELEAHQVQLMNEVEKEKLQSVIQGSTLGYKGSTSDSFSPINMHIDDENLFISQNLSIEAKLLKYIIIGDKACGKSTLFNSFFNIKNTNLEMKKTLYTASQQNLVKLELFDTSRQLIDSKIFESYMKIAHGFIFICDLMNQSSITFLREQMQTVIKYSSKNIFFFANITKADFPTENMDLFVKLIEDYHVDPKTVVTIDLNQYDPNEDSFFKEFVRNNL